MHILQIKDKDGNFVPIPAIKGNDGKSAYEQAKEGGYTGTEEEFIALLNGLTNGEDVAHRSDFDNPHNVTAEQVGLGNVDNTSDANKPVSIAQAEAISKVQTSLDTHIDDNERHIRTNGGGGIVIGGSFSNAVGAGVAVGHFAFSQDGVSVGEAAYSDNAIQLGNGINTDANTLQVYDYRLMDKYGTIPDERIPTTCARTLKGSYTGISGERDINIGGVSKILIIEAVVANAPRYYIVFETGCICFDYQWRVTTDASFIDGILHCNGDMNNSSTIYHYYGI